MAKGNAEQTLFGIKVGLRSKKLNNTNYIMLVVKNNTKYELAPQGVYQSVISKVTDLGPKEVEFEGKKQFREQVQFELQIAERNSVGRRYTVKRTFNKNLHERGLLRPFVEAVLGRALDADELGASGFDLDQLLGTNLMTQLVHVNVNGRTFANINSVQPFNAKSGEAMEIEDERDEVTLWK